MKRRKPKLSSKVKHKEYRMVTLGDIEKIREMMKKGMTMVEMSEKLYLSKSTVGKYAKQIRGECR